MSKPVKWFALGLMTILLASPAQAQDASRLSNEDLEFLEFLGGWETDEGEWVNPLELIDNPIDEPEGEDHLYDPKAKGEADDVLPQTGTEGIKAPISPVSGDEPHE